MAASYPDDIVFLDAVQLIFILSDLFTDVAHLITFVYQYIHLHGCIKTKENIN